MKAVVFGAAGWLGRAVLASFAGRHQVRAFDFGPEADETCNVARSRQGLGLEYRGDLEQYR